MSEYADWLERWATTEGMGIEPDDEQIELPATDDRAWLNGMPKRWLGFFYPQAEPTSTEWTDIEWKEIVENEKFTNSRICESAPNNEAEWSPDQWQYWCRSKRTAVELLRIWEVLP